MISRLLVLFILLYCCVGCAIPRTVAPEQGFFRARVKVVDDCILSIEVCNGTQHSLGSSLFPVGQ